MVSLPRRQVIIAGLGSFVLPVLSFAAPEEKLILSGRVVGSDGNPLPGATIAAGTAEALSDADGRFLLITTTQAYRGITCDGRPVEGFASNRQCGSDGTCRATCGLRLA